MSLPMGKLSVVLSVGVLLLGLACSSEPPQPEAPAASSAQATESPPPSIKVGTNVGQRVPEFSMLLTDGSTLTSEDLVSTGKPVFLYFFATW